MGSNKNDRKRQRSEVEDAVAAAIESQEPSAAPTTKRPRVEEKRSLFVRSLPHSATNESLADFFSQHFPVKHAVVVLDQNTKQSRGYGFVTFADAEDASEAQKALDKAAWDGRRIRVDLAERRHRNSADDAGDVPVTKPGRPAPQPTKLIVRNLPWTIKTSDQLSRLFRSYGIVKFADLPNNKGKLKGFGFVTLRGRKNAEKALEGINGKEVDGRTLAVDWAVDKATWDQQQEKEQEKEASDDSAAQDDASDEDDGSEDSAVDTAGKPVDDELNADLENFMKNHLQNLEDEDEEDEDKDNSDEEEDAGVKLKEKPQQRTTDNSSTIFIRNLPFTTTDEQLKGFFATFGNVRYARVVFDKVTEKPAGTGFVCFFKETDAKECVKGAPRPNPTTGAKQSLLLDENADPTGKYTLDGRLLQVAQAVNKQEAANLADSSLAKRQEKDKRRLFLLSEGAISAGSPLYGSLTDQEVRMRQASAAQRRKLVQGNPSLHVSLTRLSIRNLPRSIGSKELKELARKGVVGFAKDVQEGRRQPLSKEENARDGKDAKEKERQRKQKGKGIVRQTKIVFESNQGSKVTEKSGAGKSRGYGFIEYVSHHWALMGLRYLNGHQVEGDNGRKQRLIVEFSIENAQVVQRRRAAEEKSAQGSQAKDKKAGEAAAVLEAEPVEAKKPTKPARVKGPGGNKVKGQMRGGVESKESEKKEDMKQRLIARTRLTRKKKANARGKN
ncbi:ribosome biogenesis protein [Purpureocillium lavendulum]|uniref:Ribosome biogenesis protein n=1 Tax=Purpureocillium lavendulum TaxID=1247861 RepID=A0AB34FSK5_9HYPO|nr:ribosome biogenesis protein [Purpureocillium lavendulum]